jgi:flagellar protein FlaG
MLIQSSGSVAQAPVPIVLPSDGGAVGASVQPGAAAQTPQPAVKQNSAQPPTDAQLKNEVGKINAALQQANKNLELSFSVDKATNRQVVKLVDKQTGDTILQYPSDAVLAIAQGIDDFQHGLLLKQKA